MLGVPWPLINNDSSNQMSAQMQNNSQFYPRSQMSNFDDKASAQLSVAPNIFPNPLFRSQHGDSPRKSTEHVFEKKRVQNTSHPLMNNIVQSIPGTTIQHQSSGDQQPMKAAPSIAHPAPDPSRFFKMSLDEFNHILRKSKQAAGQQATDRLFNREQEEMHSFVDSKMHFDESNDESPVHPWRKVSKFVMQP